MDVAKKPAERIFSDSREAIGEQLATEHETWISWPDGCPDPFNKRDLALVAT